MIITIAIVVVVVIRRSIATVTIAVVIRKSITTITIIAAAAAAGRRGYQLETGHSTSP